LYVEGSAFRIGLETMGGDFLSHVACSGKTCSNEQKKHHLTKKTKKTIPKKNKNITTHLQKKEKEKEKEKN